MVREKYTFKALSRLARRLEKYEHLFGTNPDYHPTQEDLAALPFKKITAEILRRKQIVENSKRPIEPQVPNEATPHNGHNGNNGSYDPSKPVRLVKARDYKNNGGESNGKEKAPTAYPGRTEQFQNTPVENLWREYSATHSKDLRDHLIGRYLDLVKYNAERIHMRLPSEVDVDDLKSAGLFGLIDAIDAFDVGRGVKFETYAAQRIRGAMFDELRAMDWVPRLVRSRTSKVDKAKKALEMELGRTPSQEELRDKMGLNEGEFEKILKDSKPTGVVSLGRRWYKTDAGRDVREIDMITDDRQLDPLDSVGRANLKALITKGLSRSERLVVILYYYEEMTMREIGTVLDLSESRVSQMHASILARLKSQVTPKIFHLDDLDS